MKALIIKLALLALVALSATGCDSKMFKCSGEFPQIKCGIVHNWLP